MQQTPSPERLFGVGMLASLSAGIVAGIGGRIIMRIVALTARMPLGFSIEGTFHILLMGIFFGFMFGFLISLFTMIVSSSPTGRKYLPGPIWRGLIWGLLLLVVGLPIFVAVNAGDFVLGIPLLDKMLFGGLFILYGLTLGVAEKAFDHFLPHKPKDGKADVSASIPSESSTHHSG